MAPRDLTMNEALDAIPAAVDERACEIANRYQMRLTTAAAVGLTLAELYRDGLIDWADEDDDDDFEHEVGPRPRQAWCIHTKDGDVERQLLVYGVGYPEQVVAWVRMAAECALKHGLVLDRSTWWAEPREMVSQ